MLQKSEFESSFEAFISYHDLFTYSELATYHHDAPYKSQTCAATYLLSGTVLRNYRYSDDDVDMEGPAPTQKDNEDDDGDDVRQVQVTIVNETDLEGSSKSFAQGIVDSDISFNSCESFLRQNSFNSYIQLISIANPCINFLVLVIQYSILMESFFYFKDAGLVCAPTEYVRNTDKNGAIDLAGKVGRVVGADIKVSA